MAVVLSLRMHTSELGILLDGILKRERGRKRKDYRHPPCTYADTKAHVQTGSGLILKPMKINTVLVCSNIQLSGLRGGRGRGEGKGARERKDIQVA